MSGLEAIFLFLVLGGLICVGIFSLGLIVKAIGDLFR